MKKGGSERGEKVNEVQVNKRGEENHLQADADMFRGNRAKAYLY